MNHTALNLCLWENSLNCIFKSGKAIYTEDRTSCTPGFQVVEHSKPEFTGLVCSYGDTENLLIAFHGNSQYNISGHG